MMLPCPVCAEPVPVEILVRVRLAWRDAIKLRLAGPEVRALVVEALRRPVADIAVALTHPDPGPR